MNNLCHTLRVSLCFVALLFPLTLPAAPPNPEDYGWFGNWIDRAFFAAPGEQAEAEGSAPAAGEDTVLDLPVELPFSFVYGDETSRDLLATWQREEDGDAVSFLDPETGLQVRCEVVRHPEHAAVEWVLWFENTGTEDTPILQDIRPLNLEVIQNPEKRGEAVARWGADMLLHTTRGARDPGWLDFMPVTERLRRGNWHFEPADGRSTDKATPYFNLQCPGGGLIVAIGWSGQWSMDVQKTREDFRMLAGQKTTHFLLHPGERVRTPSILLMPWRGEEMIAGQNRFRNLLRDKYVVRREGKPLITPTTWKTWLLFAWGMESHYTEENQIEWVRLMADLGLEAHRLDGAWWTGGYWFRGDWAPDPEKFPNGLRPVTAEADRLGLLSSIFYEPEVVSPGSRVDKLHPEFLLPHPSDSANLFDLGNPEALKWVIEFTDENIRKWGPDIFRFDMNITPLAAWDAQDALHPNRQGLAEAKHVMGLYALWDSIRERHPAMIIDSCTSGGGRLDFEVMKRCIVLWRTDLYNGALTTQFQVHNMGLSLWLPIHSGSVWGSDPYRFRSAATMGGAMSWDAREMDEAQTSEFRKALAEIALLRPYYEGDYYPLTEISGNEDAWACWQYHRPDLDAGFAMLLRRPESPYPSILLDLKQIDPQIQYRCEWRSGYDVDKTAVLSGQELAELQETLPAGSSLLLRYESAVAPLD